MSSRALQSWEVGASATRLDELLGVHVRVAGGSRGRRWATRELNAAIVVHVAAHQQLFCRDLHTEAADALVDAAPTPYKPMLRRWYTDRRSLDGGNAWPETIDRDFARFDLDVWAVARRRDRRTDGRLDRLRQLNTWRNAIGHQDFSFSTEQRGLLAGTDLTLAWARRWRDACTGLARTLDTVVEEHVRTVTGTAPW